MSATPELAALKGARAVMTTEVDEGSFLSESLIKLMTGSDPIPARGLYAKPIEYVASFKLFVAGNHKVVIKNTDEGIWRRIHMVPFEVTIPAEHRDADLFDKLEEELPGILNWGLAGCLEWQDGGLKPPTAVTEAVTEYRQEMDLLGHWLADQCDLDPSLTISSSSAYQGYRCWAEMSGLRPWSHASFGRALAGRFKQRRTAAGVVYDGLALKSTVPAIQKAKVAG